MRKPNKKLNKTYRIYEKNKKTEEEEEIDKDGNKVKRKPPNCKYYYIKNKYKNRFWNALCKNTNKENWLTLLCMANKYSENRID